jgi:hypothetical protein
MVQFWRVHLFHEEGTQSQNHNNHRNAPQSLQSTIVRYIVLNVEAEALIYRGLAHVQRTKLDVGLNLLLLESILWMMIMMASRGALALIVVFKSSFEGYRVGWMFACMQLSANGIRRRRKILIVAMRMRNREFHIEKQKLFTPHENVSLL